MHKFENSWLFQREKIDNLSKNISIIKKINSFFKSYNEIQFMINIKNSLDPKNILNPGKIFDLD